MIRERYDEYLGGRPVGTWSMLAPVVAGASASNAVDGRGLDGHAGSPVSDVTLSISFVQRRVTA